MADTSQHELSEPHTNGAVDGLTEEEKSKMRPADIDADMREMERRKRVEMMMNSRLFREELERIIETQMKDGGAGPSGLLQQISDMMGAQGARFNSNVFKSSNCVVPINDIRGVESMGYAKGEKLLRCKLAAVFRLLDLYGWTQGVGGHITARLNQDQEHFLVNPYGLLYHEVTASSLVKVDMQGSVVEQGTTNFGVHVTAFQLHSTIHAARPDIKCIIHITTPSVIAVSSLKCGLLPLGQESIVIGEASVHQYIGGVFEPEEKEKISRNLGPVNKIMFLTNRGALCCGETVEEAFYNVYNTVLACETQLKLMPVGIDNLTLVSEESRKAIFDASRKPPVPQHASVAEPSPLADKLEKRWRIGGTEFEALMRMLDNAGFRTGYIYRNPLVKGEPPRPRNDVEVPPAVSSLGYLLEEEELYKQGLWKGGRKGTDRSRWLNSPNVYQKVEILETGTPDPKKITKWVDQNAEEWVTDGSPTHSSTPVRIESALQFVPKNTNPKEFKQLQQQIKDYRRADKISAGPQSHILEGVSWDEAKKMQDATISATGEQVVLVGAASKGIIQRGFQHNAMVYKTPYAKNPFDAVTDQELDQYKKDVERKQKGDPYDESQSESEALSSFNVSRATHESSTAKSPIQSPISVTSETEEESRDEPRVLRIETKQVPVPSQPEVVLSDVHEHVTVYDTQEPPSVDDVVADSRVVQQPLNQQVTQQFQNIIQQKAAVDATSEFLNEMRRTAIDPRNDSNRRDCQSSSNSSSVKSGQSYTGWTDDHYDTIHLEVTRSRTIAPRMTPMITDILHPNKNNKLALSTNDKMFKQPPPVPPKPKLNVALRNAFFNQVINPCACETAPVLEQTNDRLYSNSNNQTKTFEVDYKLHKIESAQVSEVFSICTQGTESNVCKDSQKFIDSEIKSGRTECVSVFENIFEFKESEFVKDDGKMVIPKAGKDESHKPEIVGAIFKNINDLYTRCLEIELRRDFSENEMNRSDENGNICLKDEDIEETDIEVIEIHSTKDNSLNSVESEDEILQAEDVIADMEEEIKFSELEFEEELTGTNNNVERNSVSEFTTPPRARNYLRLDTLTEVINSVKIDLTPTKMLLSMLPESNNISSKYNLDSTNMSLIYSLTPTNDDTEVDRKTSGNICEESFDNTEFKRLDSCNTNDSLHDEHSEYIWVDLLTNTKRESETINLLDSSMESLGDDDNTSNQGSDILELPFSTVQELRESDAESFNQDMKTVANQIIAELADIEMYTHASNFIDEILYDISCLKLDKNFNKRNVCEVVKDKLQALAIAKEIANTLICDLPCYERDDNDIIVINEIVHHVIDKFENSESQNSPTDSFNPKKVKESANTEIKEMQNSCKINVEKSNESKNDDHEDAVEVITVIAIDKELNLVHDEERQDSKIGEVDIDASQSLGTVDTSVEESSTLDKQESRYQSSDERLFITLESFTSPSYSRTLNSEDSESLNDSKELEQGKFHSNFNFCLQSPLDCDECSFTRCKKYEFIDDEDTCYSLNCSNSKSRSSPENTESDITDHDTLGEAILEFCTIVKPCTNPETLELNFSIERDEEKPESETAENSNNEEEIETKLTECTQCPCCVGTMPLEFISPNQLPPISEEINESLDIPSRVSSTKDVHVKMENEFDCTDSLSESEVLIADWFTDNKVVSLTDNHKDAQVSPERSVVSSESVNTFDFYSCRDESNSTAFQSLQNTAENSLKIEKDYDSDIEIVYTSADKVNNEFDRTYTLSDTSLNSLDTVSSFESDEHKQRSGKNGDATYSADVSTNIDEANFRMFKSTDCVSSSSSSDARLSNDNNYFDTTANMADVSGDLTLNKLQKRNNGKNINNDDEEPLPDCMVYSYDTREFMLLEEALACNTELSCSLSQIKSKDVCDNKVDDNVLLSPIDPPPRYEDTTLYRVVSEINLNDDDNDEVVITETVKR